MPCSSVRSKSESPTVFTIPPTSPKSPSTSIAKLPSSILNTITAFNLYPEAQNLYSTCRTFRVDSYKNETLHLENTSIDDETLINIVKSHSKVTSVNVSNCFNITAKSIEFIAQKCPKLTSLNLRGTNLDMSVLTAICHLTGLKKLDLTNCEWLVEGSLIYLRGLEQLEALYLSSCPALNNQELGLLSHLPLKILDLSGNKWLSGLGLSYLSQIKTLHTLAFAECEQLTDEDLEWLSSLKIESLDIRECSLVRGCFLAKFLNISTLNLAYCSMFEGNHLSCLTNLRWLDLTKCEQIEDKHVLLLKDSPKLTYLNLTGCDKITDKGLEVLQLLKSLKTLNLTWCDLVSDATLLQLGALTQLATIYLACCYEITNAGLQYLHFLDKLSYLDLSHCEKITSEEITQFFMTSRSFTLKVKDREGNDLEKTDQQLGEHTTPLIKKIIYEYSK